MKPVAYIGDDFLPDFGRVRAWADEASYADVVNPADGVAYPGICTSIPGWLAQEVWQGTRKLFGYAPICRAIFTRLSLAGSKAPHQAHTDASMGQYSLMLYLNRPQDCVGGTSLLRHRETGAESNPTDEAGVEIWKRDTNVADAWEPTLVCGMKANRALVFAADLYHRAEPIGGFGDNASNGRLVLTMFFDKGRS